MPRNQSTTGRGQTNVNAQNINIGERIGTGATNYWKYIFGLAFVALGIEVLGTSGGFVIQMYSCGVNSPNCNPFTVIAIVGLTITLLVALVGLYKWLTSRDKNTVSLDTDF